MKIYLAGVISHQYYEQVEDSYILESFDYIKKKHEPYLSKAKDLIVDSGAFTYMQKQSNKNLDFSEFIQDYIDFVIKNDIKYFMEFDLDRVKGLDYVEKVRERLERETERKCIPVWHVPRGIQYFKDLCEQYDYIAIGGIGRERNTNEILPKDFPKLKPLVDYAHKHGTKVHGLGFTSMKYLPHIHFDSVDSKSWLGSCWGTMFKFDHRTGRIIKEELKNKRIKDHRGVERHNLKEWIKFQQYAERNY